MQKGEKAAAGLTSRSTSPMANRTRVRTDIGAALKFVPALIQGFGSSGHPYSYGILLGPNGAACNNGYRQWSKRKRNPASISCHFWDLHLG